MAAVLIFLCALSVSSVSFAQTFDADIEGMIENMDLSQRAPTRGPIGPTTVPAVNMDVHWRLWKQVVASGQWNTTALDALRNDARSLGYHNLPVHSMAVVATARTPEVLAMGTPRTNDFYVAAQGLAPDLPYPYLEHAAFLIREDPAALPTVLRVYMTGLNKASSWLDTRAAWELKLVLLALAAMLIAGFLFLFTQLMRYFGIAAYDAARILPKGFSSNQTVILLVALVVVPGLLMQSPLLSLLILLVTVGLFQQLNERFVTVLLFAVIGLLPIADRHLATLITYPGSDAQTFLHAQYIHCNQTCIEGLRAEVEAQENPSEVLLYTYWLAQFRTGQPARLAEVLQALEARTAPQTPVRGYMDNLRGAILIAMDRPDEAIPILERARDELPPSSASAVYNLMRAYQLDDQPEAAERARGEAIARDLDVVLSRGSMERRDVNTVLVTEPLPPHLFREVHRGAAPGTISTIEPVWKALAGDKVPLSWSFFLGIGGIILVVGSSGLRLTGRTSTPCPRCGLARDPEDDEAMGHHHFCLPCYRTFVASSDLEYEARVHNENVLGRRHRLQNIMRRAFSVLLPGTGHAIAGHALLGFGVLFTISFFALLIWQPLGLWRSPYEFFTDSPMGQTTLAWVVVALCACLGLAGAFRDIEPTIVRRPGQGGKP
ncbi:MAG: tetratricopeptide repeat protein [Bradymonadaceae bacterium]